MTALVSTVLPWSGAMHHFTQWGWTLQKETSVWLLLNNDKNSALHPRISEGNFKLEYIFNSALVQRCLVSSTLVSIWNALLFTSDLSAFCSSLNWIYLTAGLVYLQNHILWTSVFHAGSCGFNVPCTICFSKQAVELHLRKTSVSEVTV